MSELNEGVQVTVEDAMVITVPLVTNLTATNAAPTAKTVGDALASKVDADSIMENVTIKVNSEQSDNQGQILIDGTGIPISEGSATSIKGAVDAVDAKTGEDIPYSGTDSTSVKATVDGVAAAAAAAGARTAADIIYDATAATPVTIKATVDAIKATVDSIDTGTDNVKFTAQSLDGTQQGIARTNIGAASAVDVTAVRAMLPAYTDVTFSQGVILSTSPGDGENTVVITSYMAGIDLASVSILGVDLTWVWPMDAIVILNNFGLTANGLEIHLATTVTQSYMLKFRILYMTPAA